MKEGEGIGVLKVVVVVVVVVVDALLRLRSGLSFRETVVL